MSWKNLPKISILDFNHWIYHYQEPLNRWQTQQLHQLAVITGQLSPGPIAAALKAPNLHQMAQSIPKIKLWNPTRLPGLYSACPFYLVGLIFLLLSLSCLSDTPGSLLLPLPPSTSFFIFYFFLQQLIICDQWFSPTYNPINPWANLIL